jgi:hypothetical protein
MVVEIKSLASPVFILEIQKEERISPFSLKERGDFQKQGVLI